MTNVRPTLVLPLFVLLAACGSSATADFGPARQVPKDQRPTVWEAPAKDRLGLQPMGPVSGQGGEGQGQKVWVGEPQVGFETLPANPAKFRDAVWKIAGQPDTDIYLTAGVGGGVVGNLTRWYRDQFGQQAVPAVEALPVVELAGRPGRLAEIKGTFNGKQPGWAALIAFSFEGDRVTSLKFTGPESVVLGNKDKFLALARSLRSATASPDAKAPPIQPGQPMPDNHPPTGNAPAPGGTGGAAGNAPAAPAPFTATVPAGWTVKTGTARVLHHTFGAEGEVYLSQLGGSLKATLDIWRGEMGQQPMSDADFEALPKMAFLGEDAVLLDLGGDFRSMSGKQIKTARMLVAARVDGGTITFSKLVGSAADVAAQADAFRQFCGSVRRAQ